MKEELRAALRYAGYVQGVGGERWIFRGSPMRILSLLSKLRRVLGWPMFALLVAGIGWGLYVWLPPEPRWVNPWSFDEARYSPDGTTVLVTRNQDSPEARLELWDVRSGAVVASYGNWTGHVWTDAVSPDFRWWAGVVGESEENKSQAPQLHIVDLTTGARREIGVVLDEGEVNFSGLKFSPNGSVLAFQSWSPSRPMEGPLRGHSLLFDVATGVPQGRLLDRSLRPAFTADSRYYLHDWLAGDEIELRAWDIEAQKPAPPLKPVGRIRSPSPNGRYVASVAEGLPGDRAMLWLWDVGAGTQQALGAERPYCIPSFSPDGRLLVVAPYSGRDPLEIWEVNTALRRRAFLRAVRKAYLRSRFKVFPAAHQGRGGHASSRGGRFGYRPITLGPPIAACGFAHRAHQRGRVIGRNRRYSRAAIRDH